MGYNQVAANIDEQGLRWKNTFGNGIGENTISSGLEGAWTKISVKQINDFFKNLFEYRWELDIS